MSEPGRDPPPETAYPPDDPWRLVVRRLLLGDSRRDRLNGALLALLLWPGLTLALWGLRMRDAEVFALLLLPVFWLLARALIRRGELRRAFMTRAGVALPERLPFNPFFAPLSLLGMGWFSVLVGLAAGLASLRPLGALAAAGGVLAAGVPLALWLRRRCEVRLGERELTVRGLMGETRVDYAAVTRLDWKPNPGSGADRLRVEAPGGGANFFGQFDRNNDLVFKVLDRIIAPRLARAQAELEKRGRIALGPLLIHRDRYERPGDRPPVRVPFALAKTAAINGRGEFVIEIPGRQEPLALLAPAEYPFVPLALRLTGALWKAAAEAQEAADDAPAPGPSIPNDEREN